MVRIDSSFKRVPQGLKPESLLMCYGTFEAVP